SEEHTSELQSLTNLVCRLLLEKKKGPIDRSHAQARGAAIRRCGKREEGCEGTRQHVHDCGDARAPLLRQVNRPRERVPRTHRRVCPHVSLLVGTTLRPSSASPLGRPSLPSRPLALRLPRPCPAPRSLFLLLSPSGPAPSFFFFHSAGPPRSLPFSPPPPSTV